MFLLLGAMAQQRHGPVPGEMLEETQGEFLAVIFNSLVTAVDRAAQAQFLAIAFAEFRPGDLARQQFIPELLAWPEVCHPNIVSVSWQSPAQAARRENSETVLGRIDFGMDGLCFEHG